MQKTNRFRAGAAASNITPPLGVSLDGTISQNGPATHIHDEIHARCVAFDDGNSQQVIVICDSTMISRAIFDAAKDEVHNRIGFPKHRMLMAATHTHSTPRLIGIGTKDIDSFYLEFFVLRIADAIQRALNNLAPAKLAWGSVQKPEHVHNRRWFMKEGTIPTTPFGGVTDQVKMNPPAGHANLVKPAGPVDPEVSFLSVRGIDNRPISLLANYGLHYVGGTQRGNVSADYFGVFADRIQQLLGADRQNPAFVGIMSNGTSGDVNNNNFRKKRTRSAAWTRMKEVAFDIADAVHKEEQQLEHRTDITLDGLEAEIPLGVRRPKKVEVERARAIMAGADINKRLTMKEVYARETIMMRDWKPVWPAIIQTLRIGPVGIVALPCEVFAETGLAIKQASPFKPTFTIELANAYGGYLPTPQQHAWGGYESWRARSSFLEIEAEPKFRQKSLEMLKQLAGS